MKEKYERLKYNLEKWQLRNEAAIGWGFLVAITAFSFWIVKIVIDLQNGGF